MKLNKYQLITASLVSLTTALYLSSSTIFASTEVIDQVSLTVPIACTMSGTGTTHTATLTPGTYSGASGSEYENGIGKTTLAAICNDDNGFSIYAIGYTNNEYGTTTLIGQNTNATIPAKAYQSDDTASNWSMKLTKVTNISESYNPQNLTLTTSYDTWHAVPAEYTKVAEYHANTGSSTTDTTLGVKLETTYAAYIASNQPADTYTGQVKYTMVHPYMEEPLQPQQATAGCINYFANASNAVGTMGCQSATDNASINLLASNFSRTGYGFAGWSDKFDYATNPEAKFYGPQETITVPEGTTANGLSLYAVWVKSEGSIQDTTKVSEVCNRLTIAPTDGTANLSSVSALTDQRDNETYAIARLADGNCWMIENLRLESTNSDNRAGVLAQGYGTSETFGNFSGLADAENTNFDYYYSPNSLYTDDGSNGTININTNHLPGNRIPRYNNYNHKNSSIDRPSDPTTNSDINSTTDAGMYSYGNYYNWPAAIADTAEHYGGYNDTTSLCPKGWRLPRGGNKSGETKNDFWVLIVKGINNNTNPANYSDETMPYYKRTPEGSDVSGKIRAYPNNFLYSGSFARSSAGSRGSSGYYWSSVSQGNSGAYVLELHSDIVRPGTGLDDRYYGNSIRCMFSPSAF